MGIDLLSLALSKKYTEDTSDGLGAVKGAPCTIKNIEKTDTGLLITFEWTGISGTKETATVHVKDGIDGINGIDGADGISISKIEKIKTIGLTDTYRMTFSNGNTFEYKVTNGRDGAGSEYSGDINVIESISVNGTALEVEDKNVNISIPTTLPASDVHEWAKTETKPEYTADEVGAISNNKQFEYDNAVEKSHIHENKEFLDDITLEKIAEWDNKSEFDGNYNSLTNTPTEFMTVNGHTVESNVPENAVFTDTVYDDSDIKSRLSIIENSYLPKNQIEASIQTAKQEAIIDILGGTVEEDFDTLKEVATWILADQTNSAELITRVTEIEKHYLNGVDKSELQQMINDLQSFVGTLPSTTTSTTVVAYIQQMIDALNIGSYALASDLMALSEKVTLIEDSCTTTGATNSSSKLFLIGALEQSEKAQTYSCSDLYVDENGKLNVSGKEVLLKEKQEITKEISFISATFSDDSIVRIQTTNPSNGQYNFRINYNNDMNSALGVMVTDGLVEILSNNFYGAMIRLVETVTLTIENTSTWDIYIPNLYGNYGVTSVNSVEITTVINTANIWTPNRILMTNDIGDAIKTYNNITQTELNCLSGLTDNVQENFNDIQENFNDVQKKNIRLFLEQNFGSWETLGEYPDAMTNVSKIAYGTDKAGNLIYVCVGKNAYHSTDGITWTAASQWTGKNGTLSIAYNYDDNIFVCCGNSGESYECNTKGIWSAISGLGAGDFVNNLIYSNGIFVGISNSIIYCYKNKTWTKKNNILTINANKTLFFANNKFYIIEPSTQTIYYSKDGLNWDNFTSVLDSSICSAIYGSNVYVAVGGYTDNTRYPVCYYSYDLQTWTEGTGISKETNGHIYKVEYVNNTFMCLGTNGHSYYSNDGIAWKSLGLEDQYDYIGYDNTLNKYVALNNSKSVVTTEEANSFTTDLASIINYMYNKISKI